MFYDYVKIFVKGGDGGNGVVTFRREKYVPLGGPSGGDGGKGADVIFVVVESLTTLVDFKYRQHYKAQRGENGMRKNMHGKNGEPLIVKVPVGTLVRDAESGELLADIVEKNQRVVVAHGGRGGRGDAVVGLEPDRGAGAGRQRTLESGFAAGDCPLRHLSRHPDPLSRLLGRGRGGDPFRRFAAGNRQPSHLPAADPHHGAAAGVLQLRPLLQACAPHPRAVVECAGCRTYGGSQFPDVSLDLHLRTLEGDLL